MAEQVEKSYQKQPLFHNNKVSTTSRKVAGKDRRWYKEAALLSRLFPHGLSGELELPWSWLRQAGSFFLLLAIDYAQLNMRRCLAALIWGKSVHKPWIRSVTALMRRKPPACPWAARFPSRLYVLRISLGWLAGQFLCARSMFRAETVTTISVLFASIGELMMRIFLTKERRKVFFF